MPWRRWSPRAPPAATPPVIASVVPPLPPPREAVPASYPAAQRRYAAVQYSGQGALAAGGGGRRSRRVGMLVGSGGGPDRRKGEPACSSAAGCPALQQPALTHLCCRWCGAAPPQPAPCQRQRQAGRRPSALWEGWRWWRWCQRRGAGQARQPWAPPGAGAAAPPRSAQPPLRRRQAPLERCSSGFAPPCWCGLGECRWGMKTKGRDQKVPNENANLPSCRSPAGRLLLGASLHTLPPSNSLPALQTREWFKPGWVSLYCGHTRYRGVCKLIWAPRRPAPTISPTLC
jgi:hypothetical protein